MSLFTWCCFCTATPESVPTMLYIWQGVFYEIDSKNQSCEKKTLQCTLHPLDIPDDATFYSTLNTGSPSIEGEGLKLNIWTGSMPGLKGMRDAIKLHAFFCDTVVKLWWHSLWLECFPCHSFSGHYTMSVTMGCLPISTFYFFESTSFLFRLVICFVFFSMHKAITTPGILIWWRYKL